MASCIVTAFWSTGQEHVYMNNLLPYLETPTLLYVDHLETFYFTVDLFRIMLSPCIRVLEHKERASKVEYVALAMQENTLEHFVFIEIDCIRNSNVVPFLRFFPDSKVSIPSGQLFTSKQQHIICGDRVGYQQQESTLIHLDPQHWMQPFGVDSDDMIPYLIAPKQFVLCDLNHRLGLGNILFILLSSYGFARQTDRVFFIQGDPISSHSGVNYKHSFLRFFLPHYTNTITQVKNIVDIEERFFDDFIPPTVATDALEWIRLRGYLQNEKYFASDRPHILYVLQDLYMQPTKEKNECVCPDYFVHIRRGDYVTDANLGVSLERYYKSALERIPKDAFTCIVSDDPAWCETCPWLKSCQVLKKYSELVTFRIMINSKQGGICANSTFSWWGLWLGRGPVRLLPRRWTNRQTTPHGLEMNPCTLIDC